MGNVRFRRIESNLGHGGAELRSIFRFIDRLDARPDQFDPELLQYAMMGKIERAVERRLSAHGWQYRIGTLLFNNGGNGLPTNGLDVGRVSELRVGHDRGGVRIDQNCSITFFAKCLTCLCSRVIEFAGLPDDDGPGTENQDRTYVITFWHLRPESINCRYESVE